MLPSPMAEERPKNGRGLPKHAICATALGQNAMGVPNSDATRSAEKSPLILGPSTVNPCAPCKGRNSSVEPEDNGLSELII